MRRRVAAALVALLALLAMASPAFADGTGWTGKNTEISGINFGYMASTEDGSVALFDFAGNAGTYYLNYIGETSYNMAFGVTLYSGTEGGGGIAGFANAGLQTGSVFVGSLTVTASSAFQSVLVTNRTSSGDALQIVSFGPNPGGSGSGKLPCDTPNIAMTTGCDTGSVTPNPEIDFGPGLPIPAVPTGLAASAADSAVTLTWDATQWASSYLVFGSSDGAKFAQIGTSSAASYTDSGLTNGSERWYYVEAKDSTGTSAASTIVHATPYGPPVASLTIGDGQATISWTGGGPPGGTYTVQRGTSASGPWTTLRADIAPPAQLVYTDADLTDGIAYWWQVLSVDSAGDQVASNIVTGTPLALPTAVTTESGNAMVQIGWTAGDGDATYDVLMSGQSGGGYSVAASAVTGTNAQITGLAAGSTEWFRIRAYAADGTPSALTAPVQGQPLAAPSLTVSATGTDGQVRLDWSAAAGASGYELQQGSAQAGPYTDVASSGTSATISGLVDRTTYWWRVRALNGVLSAQGPWSDPVSLTVSIPPPPAPTGLVALPGDGFVTLGWTQQDGALSYVLLRAADRAGPYQPVASDLTTPEYRDGTVLNGYVYWYEVAAVGAGGQGDPSSPADAEPTDPTTTVALVWTWPSLGDAGLWGSVTTLFASWWGPIVLACGCILISGAVPAVVGLAARGTDYLRGM